MERSAPGSASPPLDDGDDPLLRCLAALFRAIEAADVLGVPTDVARDVHADGMQRLGFPSDAYVLALVGGTGVGKSSLLNALAGAPVSPASARRPTTSEPVAWVPATEREALGSLFDWLGVSEVREHGADGLGAVAILDLPDMDSVVGSHRERVEALLPLVDAVVWVTDLEKYHDAILHDGFLRTWIPRLAHQAVVVNKVDRLGQADRPRIRRDLEQDLVQRLTVSDQSPVPVLMTTAAPEPDLDQFRAWLAAGAAAKAVVRARIAASAVDQARALAREAGLEPGRDAAPLLSDDARAAAVEDATVAVLRAIDLPGLERQAVAATRARARAKGTGPMGRLTSLVYRASGRDTQVADPTRHVMRWRERARLSPAVEALRAALGTVLTGAPPTVRPALAATMEPAPLRQGLERAVDRAIAGLDRLEPPTSRWWWFLGLLQTLAAIAIAVSAAWVVIWILARPVVDAVDVPIIGSVPMPFAALLASILVGYLLARLVGLHAGWVGRRWAGRLRARVSEAIHDEVSQRGLAPLDELEDARARMSAATGEVVRGCAGG